MRKYNVAEPLICSGLGLAITAAIVITTATSQQVAAINAAEIVFGAGMVIVGLVLLRRNRRRA